MSFINSDLNKQAQALEVTFSSKTKSCPPKPVSAICYIGIYQNEKLTSSHHILVRNTQMVIIRLENMVYQNNLFINFKI